MELELGKTLYQVERNGIIRVVDELELTDVILDVWRPYRRIKNALNDGATTVIEFYYVSERTGKVVGG